MKKFVLCLFLALISLGNGIQANNGTPQRHITIVGGGIIGALESYYAFQDAQKNNETIRVTVFEKGDSLASSDSLNRSKTSTNTSYNIVPSLTIDEILSVVPRGTELVKKLAILFSEPGGIRVDDVPGVNDSTSAINFKNAVTIYGADKNHDDRTETLLMLGKKSMDLWQELYDQGDSELKSILEASNFNPCREPRTPSKQALHDGYRIDLIYGIANAKEKALSMKADYEKLGYKNCRLLSPDEVTSIDPFLADYCKAHSDVGPSFKRNWKNDSIALWRPGGCIDAHVFLPKFYDYMKKLMGKYTTASGTSEESFRIYPNSEVIGVEFDDQSDELRIVGLKLSNGKQFHENDQDVETFFIFCPGEAVGTLNALGFNEPVYAGFAGASLMINIPIATEQLKKYKNFSHCMEVHNEGIVLAWQARTLENSIFIGVAGTKAFYGDRQPHKDEAFAKNRNLVQLNMVNNVLPEFISLALGYDTKGKELAAKDLSSLEAKGIAKRWVGRRAVAYDGFPTLGALYSSNHKVSNARCTTHLGSGGVSFGPGAVFISRNSEQNTNDAFINKVLTYGDSRRTASSN